MDGQTGLRDEALSGDGRFLYAIDADAQRVLGWAVGEGGSLSPIGHKRECPRPWPGSRPAETMRLESLYRATFTTPAKWSVELAGPAGTEGQSFLLAKGRCEGRLSGRLHGANYPRRRTDNALVPDFRGVLQTADGAAVRFAWHGYARPGAAGMRELVGSITHVCDDERYRWLNDAMCLLTGEVQPRSDGSGSDVGYDVAELVWEPRACR